MIALLVWRFWPSEGSCSSEPDQMVAVGVVMGQCYRPFDRIVNPTDEDRRREKMWQGIFAREPIKTMCSAKYARKGDVLITGTFHKWTTEELHCNIRLGNVITRIWDKPASGNIYRFVSDCPDVIPLGYMECIRANVTLNAYARKIQRWWRRTSIKRRDAAVLIQREWRFAVASPTSAVCRRRLRREFLSGQSDFT